MCMQRPQTATDKGRHGGAPDTHRAAGRGHDDACPVERVGAAGRLYAIEGQLGADQEDGQADERVQQTVPAGRQGAGRDAR